MNLFIIYKIIAVLQLLHNYIHIKISISNMPSVHKTIVFIGFISLFHSAFSAAQHRTYLRITSQEFTTLPLDIVIQAVISLFAVMWGVLNVAGNLREIPAGAELNLTKWETQKNLPSFYIFNHRGKAMSKYYKPGVGKVELENMD